MEKKDRIIFTNTPESRENNPERQQVLEDILKKSLRGLIDTGIVGRELAEKLNPEGIKYLMEMRRQLEAEPPLNDEKDKNILYFPIPKKLMAELEKMGIPLSGEPREDSFHNERYEELHRAEEEIKEKISSTERTLIILNDIYSEINEKTSIRKEESERNDCHEKNIIDFSVAKINLKKINDFKDEMQDRIESYLETGIVPLDDLNMNSMDLKHLELIAAIIKEKISETDNSLKKYNSLATQLELSISAEEVRREISGTENSEEDKFRENKGLENISMDDVLEKILRKSALKMAATTDERRLKEKKELLEEIKHCKDIVKKANPRQIKINGNPHDFPNSASNREITEV